MFIIVNLETVGAVHTHTHTGNIIRKIICCPEHYMFGQIKEIFLVISESFYKLSCIISILKTPKILRLGGK